MSGIFFRLCVCLVMVSVAYGENQNRDFTHKGVPAANADSDSNEKAQLRLDELIPLLGKVFKTVSKAAAARERTETFAKLAREHARRARALAVLAGNSSAALITASNAEKAAAEADRQVSLAKAREEELKTVSALAQEQQRVILQKYKTIKDDSHGQTTLRSGALKETNSNYSVEALEESTNRLVKNATDALGAIRAAAAEAKHQSEWVFDANSAKHSSANVSRSKESRVRCLFGSNNIKFEASENPPGHDEETEEIIFSLRRDPKPPAVDAAISVSPRLSFVAVFFVFAWIVFAA